MTTIIEKWLTWTTFKHYCSLYNFRPFTDPTNPKNGQRTVKTIELRLDGLNIILRANMPLDEVLSPLPYINAEQKQQTPIITQT